MKVRVAVLRLLHLGRGVRSVRLGSWGEKAEVDNEAAHGHGNMRGGKGGGHSKYKEFNVDK